MTDHNDPLKDQPAPTTHVPVTNLDVPPGETVTVPDGTIVHGEAQVTAEPPQPEPEQQEQAPNVNVDVEVKPESGDQDSGD